jgi:protein-S-isoprenylcysteine O-methyltransferase Ste14
MPLSVPVSPVQIWVFVGLSLVFFLFLIRASSSRTKEAGSRLDQRSRLGILLQSLGFVATGLGPPKPTLLPLSTTGLAGTAAVILLMSSAVAMFAASSRALGPNWSLVARTRSDHELVRRGPYARVRHPIYLGMLLFLLALAVALGHWLQLVIGLPLFFAGTVIRTRIEDQLLEQAFGDVFRDYRDSTPALLPRLF